MFCAIHVWNWVKLILRECECQKSDLWRGLASFYKTAIVQSMIANLEQGAGGSQKKSFIWFSYDIMVRWMELYISFQSICKLYSEIGAWKETLWMQLMLYKSSAWAEEEKSDYAVV